MLNTIFVYGSLMPGQSNHHIVEHIPGTWEKASVQGELYRFSSGADKGFATMTLGIAGQEIFGWVLDAENLDQYLADIDEFEGDYYKRVTARVTLEQGAGIEAYTFVLNDTIHGIRSMLQAV